MEAPGSGHFEEVLEAARRRQDEYDTACEKRDTATNPLLRSVLGIRVWQTRGALLAAEQTAEIEIEQNYRGHAPADPVD